jgi:hypothetical protein
MMIGINWLALLVLLAVLALLIGTPTSLLVFGIKRHRRLHSLGAKVMIGTGLVIFLVYLSAIVSHVVAVGPYRSGILAKGTSPDGAEYCVVQTYKPLGLIGEPYQVSFYMRDADRIWRWQYLAHQDDAWRDVAVDFSGGKAQVSHSDYPVRELSLPTGGIDTGKMREGDNYLPASYSAADVLKWHNTKFTKW